MWLKSRIATELDAIGSTSPRIPIIDAKKRPTRVTLDLDVPDNPIHGNPEGRSCRHCDERHENLRSRTSQISGRDCGNLGRLPLHWPSSREEAECR
jgi:hypothetical protein